MALTKTVLFFLAGVVPTADELALIDRLTYRYANVFVRNTLQSAEYGDHLEPADALAGTIPATYLTGEGSTVDTDVYPDGDASLPAEEKAEAVLLISPPSVFAPNGTEAAITTLGTNIGTAQTTTATAKTSTAAAVTAKVAGAAITALQDAMDVLQSDGAVPTEAHVDTADAAWDTVAAAITALHSAVDTGDTDTGTAKTAVDALDEGPVSTALALMVPGTSTVSVGGTLQLVAVKADLNEDTDAVTLTNITAVDTTYASSNEAKATVDSAGIVTGVEAGSATITATHTYAEGLTQIATRAVTVA